MLIAVVLTLSLLALLLPRSAGAFWPFTGAQAQAAETEVHDSQMELLDAAINEDPNPDKRESDLAVTGDSALMANVGPEGTLSQSTHQNEGNGGQISTYTVKEGDNISEIAANFGVSVNTILWANDIANVNTIRPGDSLLILPVTGLQYTVRSGDTLNGIAGKYNADADEIALFNGLASSADLVTGTDIIIPGGKLAAAPKKTITTKPKVGTAKSTTLPVISGFFGNPLPGGRISQGIHGYNGIDIAAPSGTPIYAAAAGSIIVAKNNDGYNGGYGNYIVIDHGNGTQTLYAHMSSTAVSGGAVAKGDPIGYVGNTGKSTGFHLHFEVRGAKNPLAN